MKVQENHRMLKDSYLNIKRKQKKENQTHKKKLQNKNSNSQRDSDNHASLKKNRHLVLLEPPAREEAEDGSDFNRIHDSNSIHQQEEVGKTTPEQIPNLRNQKLSGSNKPKNHKSINKLERNLNSKNSMSNNRFNSVERSIGETKKDRKTTVKKKQSMEGKKTGKRDIFDSRQSRLGQKSHRTYGNK